MPAYNTISPPYAIWPGDMQTVWSTESPTAGTASQQVALGERDSRGGTPFSADIQFGGNPGTFEVDVQVANVDQDSAYYTLDQGTTNDGAIAQVNAGFAAHLDAPFVTAKFVRLKLVSLQNAVTVTGSFSR
jgi:hypothetical protein